MITHQGKTLLVVNAATPKKSYTLAKLKELQITIVCLNSVRLPWAEQYVDHWVLADTYDHETAIKQIEKFKKDNPQVQIDGVVTFWEDDVLLTSKITDHFGFIGIPYAISQLTRNKFKFREFCHAHDVPAPQHRLVKTEADLAFVLKNFHFPLIIKPAFGSHSAFVSKANNETECRERVAYIRQHLSASVESALTDGGDIVVEEYLDGQEVDIDLLIQNSQILFYSVTDNNDTTEPYFVETGESIPSAIPPAGQKELMAMVEKTVQALGIKNGCLHFEAKLTSRGPFPIEVNLRMGGGEVYFFNEHAWGVNLIEHLASIALGVATKPQKAKEPLAYIATEQFLPEYSGTIVDITIDPEVEKLGYVGELVFERKNNEEILAAPEGYDCIGWVTTFGKDITEALGRLAYVKKLITYRVIPKNKI